MQSNDVRLISVNLTMGAASIPEGLKLYEMSNPGRKERTAVVKVGHQPSGKKILEGIQTCSLGQFLGEVEERGYGLVNAKYDQRTSPDRTWHVASYFFVLRELADSPPRFEPMRDILLEELRLLLQKNVCAVRTVWKNPDIVEGHAIPGRWKLDINVNQLRPISSVDDKPVRLVFQNGEVTVLSMPMPN